MSDVDEVEPSEDVLRVVAALDELMQRRPPSEGPVELLGLLESGFDPDRAMFEVTALVAWVAAHLTPAGVDQLDALLNEVLRCERAAAARAPSSAGDQAPTPWTALWPRRSSRRRPTGRGRRR